MSDRERQPESPNGWALYVFRKACLVLRLGDDDVLHEWIAESDSLPDFAHCLFLLTGCEHLLRWLHLFTNPLPSLNRPVLPIAQYSFGIGFPTGPAGQVRFTGRYRALHNSDMLSAFSGG